jgi:hypothetical protein
MQIDPVLDLWVETELVRRARKKQRGAIWSNETPLVNVEGRRENGEARLKPSIVTY